MAAVRECPVCGIGLSHYEVCPSPSCPCYGMRAGSPEAEMAASRHFLGIPQNRTMPGQAALDHLEMRARSWLMELRGDVIDIEIEHRSVP